jgi:hypothetical protein
MGISREHAVNILRTAAATNQVRLRIKHYFPPLSSSEYQKLLYDEKSTDDDEDNKRNQNNNNNTTNQVRMRRSSRKHHHQNEQRQQYRHSAHNFPYENNKDEEQDDNNKQLLQGLDVSHDALQSLINSRFKLIDLVDLLKKTYPKLLLNDQNRELQFVQQLSETNTGERFTFLCKL